MKRVKVGLNGFGRIGRAFTRIAFKRNSFDIVAVNTRKTTPELLAYFLKYDSVYGRFEKEVSWQEDGIVVDGKKIYSTNIPNPEEIPWDKYGVDIVVEATGAFRKMADLKKHFREGVKHVILTAPSKDDETPHVVLGVNDSKLDLKSCSVVSNASCTTNSASPLFFVLDKAFGVERGFLATTRSYTPTQNLLDNPAKTLTRGRAAALNVVPTTTGAAKAVTKTLPHLKGKIEAVAFRTPVPTVGITQIYAIVKKNTTVEEINKVFKKASETYLKGILGYEETPLVSSDYIGSPYSTVFDANYTKVIGGNFVQICGWYDNEWGYATRLVDLVEKFASFYD